MTVVLDTNVLVVAHEQAIEPGCVIACLRALEQARHGRYALDDGHEILGQYKQNVADSRPHTPGFEFLMFTYQTQWTPERCERVSLTPDDERCYAEFPDDPALEGFDRSDRVFAAVARNRAPVLNATDSDWFDHKDALAANGILVTFLCASRFAKTSTEHAETGRNDDTSAS